MKILHVFPILPPNTNGTISIIKTLTKALAAKGHDVAIFTSDYKLTQDYVESLSPVKIYTYNTATLFAMAQAVIPQYEILHLHCFRSLQNIAVYLYARKYKVPYIIDQHGSLPLRVPEERGYKWLVRWLYDVIIGKHIMTNATKLIAQNDWAVREYREFNAKHRLVRI